jgi:SAM-dependent methyltransferase
MSRRGRIRTSRSEPFSACGLVEVPSFLVYVWRWRTQPRRPPVVAALTDLSVRAWQSGLKSPLRAGFPTVKVLNTLSIGTGTEEYYNRWAPEYDQVYSRPERQDDFAQVRGRLTEWFGGKRVLELAAGTGWWTSVLADCAASVLATDVNWATLDVARLRRSWPTSVDFVVADALQVQVVEGEFDAAFAGFFWSHVPLNALDSFLNGLMLRLLPGSLVVFMDNRLVPGSVHPIARSDNEGNTYQRRQMGDGSSWDVLKNFPEQAEVRARLGRFGQGVGWQELDNFWLAWCWSPK